MAVGKGDGTTFTFAGFTYKVTNISVDGISVAVIKTGDLTATVRGKEAGNIVDYGTITFDIEFDGAITLPTLGGVASNLLIDIRGEGVGSIFDADSFLQDFSFSAGEGTKMVGRAVFEVTEALDQN